MQTLHACATLQARDTPQAEIFMQALEYQMQQGIAEAARQDVCLMPLGAQHEYGPELHSNVCVLKLLQPA